MPLIKVLSKEISELIAAGEVIERPASVIKELVENSIDAGAEHITVEIEKGGTIYMRVTDDGCGMAFDDVPTSFLRHATSKIIEKDDLDNIITLGFRGEALASLAAVGKVEVMTKQKGDSYGTIYSVAGSEEIYHEKSGCPDGTTVVIRDLFYNVPARAKFLKKDVTEANAVSNIVQKIALSHPEISFKFIRDNRIEFNSAGDGELYSAIYAVYGKDFARDLIPVDYTYNGIQISGYTVKPLYAKNNRSFQNFFVNGRYIHSKLCAAALENAYTNIIMTGKFPTCVLMISISPHNMDVNIHPSKAEVRFTDEKTMTDAVYFSIKNALMNDGLIYEFEINSKPNQSKKAEVSVPEPPKKEFIQQEIIFTPVAETKETEKSEPSKPPIHSEPKVNIPSEPIPKVSEDIPKPKKIDEPPVNPPVQINMPPEPVKIADKKKPDIRIVGEVFGLYIIAECDGKMIIIDKHAAHERIIFERLKSRNCRQYSQALLTEVKMLFTSDEIDVIENNTELLADMGFTFDLSERPCIKVTAVPTFITDNDIESIIIEITENLQMYRQNPQTEVLDDMLHTVACKSAVKANDKNSTEEMKSLAEQVISDENIRHCPHGRPVMFVMTKSNIDHQFRRK